MSDARTSASGAFSIRNAGKVYDPLGASVVALDDCSVEIGANEFIALVGPSGCGKSTLLNIMAGFDTLTSGAIYLDGSPLATPEQPARPGADRVVVFQHGALFPWMTVLDNVTYGLTRQGRMGKAEARDYAHQFLEKAGGLDKVAQQFPGQISSGMQRRVEFIRALIIDPKILLLDEPFRAMDTVTQTRMHRYLLQMNELFPKTTMFVTHDLDEAILLSDTVVVMTTRPGRVKLKVRVDLPRPRTPGMINAPEFLALKKQMLAAVHEEAQKAFERGERELV
ncbi:MAG: ABC transporter ATP-binding protein [Methyloligellaceae bacterium]